jgi:UDP-2-acetamido-2-deoxy-ribo-hexuluronate aminotransferase
VEIPYIAPYNDSTWAQYTVRSDNRTNICKVLKENNIPTAIHYPIPLHKQDAFSCIQYNNDEYPVSNRISQQVFSLPMHPFLTSIQVEEVVGTIRKALSNG